MCPSPGRAKARPNRARRASSGTELFPPRESRGQTQVERSEAWAGGCGMVTEVSEVKMLIHEFADAANRQVIEIRQRSGESFGDIK